MSNIIDVQKKVNDILEILKKSTIVNIDDNATLSNIYITTNTLELVANYTDNYGETRIIEFKNWVEFCNNHDVISSLHSMLTTVNNR